MDQYSLATQVSYTKHRAKLVDTTRVLTPDSTSFSQPQPPAYRSTTAVVPPRSSSLAAAADNLKNFKENGLAPEIPQSIDVSSESQRDKDGHWARLKRMMGRSYSFHSSSTLSSLNAMLSVDDTDSKEFSIRISSPDPDTTSTKTEESSLATWGNAEYTKQVQAAADQLKNDFVSGAREMAEFALEGLSSMIVVAAWTAKSREELWDMSVAAAKYLSVARPSMNAAITSCLIRALDEVRQLWEALDKRRTQTTMDLAAMARRQLTRIIEKRKEAGLRLGENFAERLKAYCRQRLNNTHAVTLLTLSNSSTIRSSILTTLTNLRFLSVTLLILESRPRFEGVTMASQIISSTSAEARSRLQIRVFPDCAVATAVKDANLILLGADRISASGDVSNKIGSLAAAVCAKQLNPKAQIVAVSDADKIVAKGVEEGEKEAHPHGEMTEAWSDETRRQLNAGIYSGAVEVVGEWFEWVPAQYVDGYVTENGTLDASGVEAIAGDIGELKEKIFG